MRVRLTFMLLAGLSMLFCAPAFALNQAIEVDASTLSKWVTGTKDLVLIDVGTPGDFAEGHIPGSISMPLNRDFAVQANGLSKKKTYVLVCPTGMRSLKATQVLMEQGFEKVYNLKGGVTDWLRQGFKVDKGA
jgi:rhodanese-related sulfurtransferase